jgi:hypothetical protein
VEAATLLPDYEAKIVALERMVGRQALEVARCGIGVLLHLLRQTLLSRW